MRAGAAVIACAALLIAASRPAAADDMAPGPGGSAFVNDEGSPTAAARDATGSLPTGKSRDEPDCVWTVVVRDDRTRPVYDKDGNRVYSETGRWLQMVCNQTLRYVDGWPLIPEEGRIDPAAVAREALRSVSIAAPVVATSPDASKALYVRVPTWLWVDASWWRSYEATASAGRVSATVAARPVRATWEMGDGATAVCAGPGTPWRQGLPESASSCQHTYVRSSAAEPDDRFVVRAEVELEVTWTSNVGASGRLSPIRRSVSFAVPVAEIQAVGAGE
jgi:hypothetical protein